MKARLGIYGKLYKIFTLWGFNLDEKVKEMILECEYL
jgi:hypothetical protein